MNEKPNNWKERAAFIFLIAGMTVAGYAYQANKDAMPKAMLVSAIILFLLLLWIIYQLLVRAFVKR